MKISWRILHTDVKQSHSTSVRFVILRQTSDSSEQLSTKTMIRYKLCKILVHVILISKTEMKLPITNSKRKARKNLVTWSASPFAVKTRTVVFLGSRRMQCVLGLSQALSFSWVEPNSDIRLRSSGGSDVEQFDWIRPKSDFNNLFSNEAKYSYHIIHLI